MLVVFTTMIVMRMKGNRIRFRLKKGVARELIVITKNEDNLGVWNEIERRYQSEEREMQSGGMKMRQMEMVVLRTSNDVERSG